MNFRAKIILKEEGNAQELIQAYFREFNPESSIFIKGNQGTINVFFEDKPPMETIIATSKCYVQEFGSGEKWEEYSRLLSQETPRIETHENEPKQQPNPEEQEILSEESTSQENTTNGENTEELPQLEKAEETATTTKKRARRPQNIDVKIPQLDELAQKATSFDHFLTLVVEWFEMGKRTEIFKNVLIVGCEVEKISWKEIEVELDRRNVKLADWDRIWLNKKVPEKLQDKSITIMPLLSALRRYKNDFTEHEHLQTNTEPQTAEITSGEIASSESEGQVFVSRVCMECMPEIPYFEETLSKLDKTKDVEDRIKYVLNAMGLEKKCEQDRSKIIKISCELIKTRVITDEVFFTEESTVSEEELESRMIFSTFINEFVKKYDPQSKVRVKDFLKQLQQIVMTESELKSLTS